MKKILTIFIFFTAIFFYNISCGVSSHQRKDNLSEKVKDTPLVDKSQKESDDILLVVNGSGRNEYEATKNALRSAIEQTYGTFVSANTKLLDDELIKDEIVTVSSGNIKSYEVISTTLMANGDIEVSLSALVSIGKLVSYVENHGGATEFAGQTFVMNVKMWELNKKNERIAIDNMLTQLKQIKHILYDYSIQVGEPVKTAAVNVSYYRGYGVERKDSGYVVPICIEITPTINLRKWFGDLEATLNSLSLAKEEAKNMNDHGFSTYWCDYYKLRYILRNNIYNYYGDFYKDCLSILNSYFNGFKIHINDSETGYSPNTYNQIAHLNLPVLCTDNIGSPIYFLKQGYIYRTGVLITEAPLLKRYVHSPSSLKHYNSLWDVRGAYETQFFGLPFSIVVSAVKNRKEEQHNPLWKKNDPMPKIEYARERFSLMEDWKAYCCFEMFFSEKELGSIRSFSVKSY